MTAATEEAATTTGAVEEVATTTGAIEELEDEADDDDVVAGACPAWEVNMGLPNWST